MKGSRRVHGKGSEKGGAVERASGWFGEGCGMCPRVVFVCFWSCLCLCVSFCLSLVSLTSCPPIVSFRFHTLLAPVASVTPMTPVSPVTPMTLGTLVNLVTVGPVTLVTLGVTHFLSDPDSVKKERQVSARIDQCFKNPAFGISSWQAASRRVMHSAKNDEHIQFCIFSRFVSRSVSHQVPTTIRHASETCNHCTWHIGWFCQYFNLKTEVEWKVAPLRACLHFSVQEPFVHQVQSASWI